VLVRAIISAVYNWAEDRELLEASPAHGIKIAGEAKVRSRVYSEGELRRFWLALAEDEFVDGSVTALKLLILTGKQTPTCI